MWVYELTNTEIWIYATLAFIVRYLIIAGGFYVVFYWLLRKRFSALKIQSKIPGTKQLKEEVLYSVLTFIIYGSSIWLFLYWMNKGMTKKYDLIADFGTPYFLFSIILMIVLHDAYFYWTHRLIHHPALFPYVHRTHHKFKTPTPWASFAFHPWEAVISLGIVPLIIFTIPFHQGALVCFISFMVLNNVLIHLGYEIRGLWLSKIQNSSAEHDRHHLKGHGNYGLYFTIWDRLMGTYFSKEGTKDTPAMGAIKN